MKEDKNQSREQEFIVDNQETVLIKDQEMNDRINKLFGETKDSPKKELKDYDPAELFKTRKKLLFLFVGVIVAGVIIIALLFNPLDLNFGKKDNVQNQDENNDPNINEEIEYPIDLELWDDEVIQLNKMINFSIIEQKEIDLFQLYTNDSINVSDISNEIKMFLLKRHDNFYSMLYDNKVQEYVNTCNPEGITIEKAKFDDVYKSIYGNDSIKNYRNINYDFPIGDYQYKKITLTFDSDKYIIKCNDYNVNDNITKFVQQELAKAIETENTIELYQNVVFVSYVGNIGVYKEPAFKTLITNDKNAGLKDYITLGNVYKYTFEKDGNNRYLSKIELIKEDN